MHIQGQLYQIIVAVYKLIPRFNQRTRLEKSCGRLLHKTLQEFELCFFISCVEIEARRRKKLVIHL